MSEITVTTAAELKKAIQAEAETIIVKGKFAKKVMAAQKIKKLSPAVLASIGALAAASVPALLTGPVTGGGSYVAFAAAAAPVVAASGISIEV